VKAAELERVQLPPGNWFAPFGGVRCASGFVQIPISFIQSSRSIASVKGAFFDVSYPLQFTRKLNLRRVGHGVRLGGLSKGEPLELGIEFAVFWWDQNLIEFQVTSSNGYFAGWANIYVGHNMLPELAERLKGFPSSTRDSRDFELGTFDPKFADGGLRMHFYCLDSVGHAAVEIKIRGDGCEALGEVESVALRIPIEAAGVDSFIAQVKAMDTEQLGATARLPMGGRRE
jgi:hypothetical protein